MHKAGGNMRFGILMEGPILKQWQYDTICRLLEEGHELQLVITCNYQESKVPEQSSRKEKFLGKNALYHLHQRFIHHPPLLANKDCSTFLASYTNLHAYVERTGRFTDRFLPKSVADIESMKLDFILRFGLNIIRGDVLQAAKYGIWSLHHDDERIIRGGPPGFWEIYKQHSINGILLQKLTEELDNGIVLRKAYAPVIHHSWKAHHNELLRKGIDLVVFAANELSKTAKIQNRAEDGKKGVIHYFPKNSHMLRFYGKIIWNKIRFHLQDLFVHENWNFGIAELSQEALFEGQNIDKVIWHPNPDRHRFYADAFFAKEDQQAKVYFENFDFRSYKAHIEECVFENNAFTSHRKVLEKDVHLSFPFPLEYQNKHFILPEAHQSNLLTAVDNERKEMLIFNRGAIDAVVFRQGELWWMFCTFKAYGSNEHLFAFYNTDLNSDWVPHQRNPIVSDARCARMAGEIVTHNEKLYRPAQINHQSYGSGIVWQEIIQLSPEDYAEKKAFEMWPNKLSPYNKGMHTISFQEGLTLVDAKNNKFVFSEFLRKLKHKLKLA